MQSGHGPVRPLQISRTPDSVAPAELSFEQVFRAEAPQVGRTLRYLGVREAEVEDACQEVFVVVHRRLAQFEGGSLRAWVRQICVHVASNYRRSKRRHPEDAVAEPPEVAAPAEQQEAVERQQQRRQLLALLDQLPAEQREVFVLFEIEQMTMPNTATTVGCPLQTAYSRLYAARDRMQSLLQGTS